MTNGDGRGGAEEPREVASGRIERSAAYDTISDGEVSPEAALPNTRALRLPDEEVGAETLPQTTPRSIPEEASGEEVGAETLPPAPGRMPELGLVVVSPEHYEIQGELARGGMGLIRRARDLRVGREVVIKELLSPSRTARLRFEREARVTAQLQHPSIVPVYEVGRWPNGSPFYSMKRVAGRPLDEVVSEALDPDARLALIPRILPAVEAIAYAHEQGVIHRDLKPANILLGDHGETVVIDWGLAARVEEREPKPRSESASGDQKEKLTLEGAIVGTPSYMPPEQAVGARVDKRADVYALGALLYHTLSGRPPYQGGAAHTVISELLTGPPPPLSELAPTVPADLIGIVDKAMAKRVADRYADAGEMARDLSAFTTGRLVAAYRYTSWELVTRFVRKNRALTAAVAALFVLAVAGAVAVVDANRASERQRERAVAAERRALEGERSAHERLARAHWAAAVRRQQRGDHLEAEVLAAGALVEQAASRETARRLGARAPDPTEEAAGPGGTWAMAKALGFATRGRTLRQHEDWLYDLLPSPDGRWVVSSSADGRALIRSARTAEVHRALEGHRNTVFQMALRADGRELATSSYDGTVRLWSFPEGSLVRALEHPPDRIYGLCYGPDGALFVAIPGEVVVYDPRSGERAGRIEATSALPWRLHCPSGSRWGVLGGQSPELFLLDLEARRIARRIEVGEANARCAILSPDSRQILTMDRHGVLRRFDRETGAEVDRADLRTECKVLVSSPDGRWLAIGGEEILIVDARTLRPVTQLHGHRSSLLALAFDRTGRRLYSGGRDDLVIEWQIVEGSAGLSLPAPSTSEVDSVCLSEDGRWLASAGDDPVVRLWDLRSGEPARTFEGHTGPVRGLSFLDRDRLLSAGLDRTLRIWDLRAGTQGPPIPLPDTGDEISVARGGGRVAVGSGTAVGLFDPRSGALRVIPRVHRQRTWWVGFDPAGERLASTSFAGEIALLDPESGQVTRRWAGHRERIYDADWRPDGGELTTADLGGWVRGWDPASGEEIRAWRVLDGEEVLSLAWSPDASRLLVTTTEGARVFRPDGTLTARADLGARTRAGGWTEDGRALFAAEGRVFLLPLDAEAWSGPPEALLRASEERAGVSLDALLGAGTP